MREVTLAAGASDAAAAMAASVATILELRVDEVPHDVDAEVLRRWLGGLGMGLVPVAGAESYSFNGPWVARVRPGDGSTPRAVVMYGVPSGVAYDPTGVTSGDGWRIESGFVIAALDIALARPLLGEAPRAAGAVEGVWVAPEAGASSRSLDAVRALPGRGLEGDRHVDGRGTFPSGVSGAALTLIEAEVCESFDPPLGPNEHRRNVLTRGIELNALVGHEFSIGAVRCRGARLCEPCTVIDRYAARPVLRALVHRGGLRADILDEGEIRVGDAVRAS